MLSVILKENGLDNFTTQFNVKTRGAAILIHKDIAFQAEEVIADSNGRFVIGKLFYLPVILVNVYAPNFDDHTYFYKTLFYHTYP